MVGVCGGDMAAPEIYASDASAEDLAETEVRRMRHAYSRTLMALAETAHELESARAELQRLALALRQAVLDRDLREG